MKRPATRIRLAIVLALLAGATAASAADFTFNVPLSLKSILPADAPGVLICHVYSSVPPPGLGNIPRGADSIGLGSRTFTLTKGGFVGTLAVSVDASPGKDPANARGYVCYLNLAGQNCTVSVDAQPCRGAAAAGNAVEVKGEIRLR